MGVPISNVTRRVVYTASGTGPYSFTFEILANTDIAVYKDDTLLTLTTDYTVTINTNGTGSVTLTASPTGATQIAIVGNRTIQRSTDFVTGGDFFANTVNNELDQQTIFAQQNAEGLQRALQAPQTDPTSINMTLPGKAARAGKTLSFDSNGNPTPGVSASDVANAVSYATNAANSATAAASSASSASSSASTASTKASEASTSATNAASSASSASTSATNAASSASSASTSASNASTSATNAASSASSASTSASSASTSATNASNSATAAATSATNAGNSATAAASSASAAATSETNAASSAAAAAASAASGMYSAVQDKSANYSVVAADAGDLIRVTTSGGARTITLPTIGSTGITDGFKIAIVKWTGDGNAVTINRAGSDTINGATSYTLGNQYSSVTLVADLETNQWFAAASGLGTSNANVDVFNGNGSTVAFTLSGDPGNKNNTAVTVGGVYQAKATYSVSGTTLTFTQAPPSGTGNIEVVWNSPLAIGVPTDNTVSTAKIQDGAITTSKIADGAVVTQDIANNAVTPAKMANAGAEFGMRNRIINGAMMIDQRNAGAALTVNSTSQFFPVDRWVGRGENTDGVFTIQQSTTAPTTFRNSIVATVTTADAAIGSSQRYEIYQRIEGNNMADLMWGTAAATTITLSFWVRSSLTGTFGGALINGDSDRSYPFSYTISSANTWEQKSITVAGDTSGTWQTNNNIGIWVDFSLGAGASRLGTAGAWAAGLYTGATGQTNLIATNGATFYITGVQLEKGSTATSFDYRPYGTELALCQRYYGLTYVGLDCTFAGANQYTACSVPYPVTMRSSPTITNLSNINNGNLTVLFNVGTGASNPLGGTTAQGTNTSTGRGYWFGSYSLSSEL